MRIFSLSFQYKDIRITVPWGHVCCRWYGNTQVRPILAIHGWLDNIGTWDKLIPLLPQHIGVLCVDLPGHGQSSRLPKGIAYHAIEYVNIIVLIMKEYKWHKISLMGHSMGSLICFIYASIYPRTVDLLIAIDIIKPVYRSTNLEILRFARNAEKTLIEDERYEELAFKEPPSYTYEELEKILYDGSWQSVEMENSKYLLNRSIMKSTKYPNKYYFSRDGRVKYYFEFNPSPGLVEEMAKRIRNVPYFVAKGSESSYINEDSMRVIEILQERNPHFELYEVSGTHHLHLNNAKELSLVLNPFIHRHRPAILSRWSLSEIDESTKDVVAGNRNRLWKSKIKSKL